MIRLDDALAALRLDIIRLARLETDRLELLNSTLPPALKDERDRDLQMQIGRLRELVVAVLADLVAFPPQHFRHDQLLAQFYNIAEFEKSIFVMTKFPDPKNSTPADEELATVIQAVRDAVKKNGYVARVATDTHFHPVLWDNVELYLLGCRRGIAIVEDKYLPELNPNVAMEWGWMRGMGRSVLYLVEKDFKKQRADWGGLIESRFDWGNPAPDVETGVGKWLNGI